MLTSKQATLQDANKRAMNFITQTVRKLELSPQKRKDMLNRIGLSLVQNTKLRFKDSMAPDGTPWAGLSQPRWRKRSKAENKRLRKIVKRLNGARDDKYQYFGKPLLDTGRLRNSISHVATSNYLDVGTNVSYGKKHQEGEKKIIARPYLGLSYKDEDVILTITNLVLSKELKKNGY